MMTPAQIGDRVHRFRDERNLTVKQAAALAGKDSAWWVAVELGDRAFDAFTLARVAVALDVAIEDLTDEVPLRDRLRTTYRGRAPQTAEEHAAVAEFQERVTRIMEIDRYLRSIRVGRHNVKP